MEETALTFGPLTPMDPALAEKGHRVLAKKRRQEARCAAFDAFLHASLFAFVGLHALGFAWGSIALWGYPGSAFIWIGRLVSPILSALMIVMAAWIARLAVDDWRTLTGKSTALPFTPATRAWAELEAALAFRLACWNTRAENLNPVIAVINVEGDKSPLAQEWRFAYAYMLAERRNIERLASRIPPATSLASDVVRPAQDP